MMRRMKYFKVVIAAALIAVILCGSALADDMGAMVLSSSMAVYNSNQQYIGSLGQGTSFTVTAMSGDWARISYRGNTGYAQLKDIVFDARIKAVSIRSTPVRFVTQESYRRGVYYTGTLSPGVTLYVAGMNGSDFLFFDGSGTVMGYVAQSALVRAD